MLKGLIFDLDGVLTDSARFHLKAWQDLALELKINLTNDQLESLRGISRMDSLDLILKYGGQEGRYTEQEKKELAAKKNANFVEQIKLMTPKDILPGITTLLTNAHEQGLKLVIASASKNAPTILTKLEIMNQFDGIVDPSTLHKGKPDPEIYLKAQALVGLQASEVISFEDAKAGVEAIKSAGQFAVGIGDSRLLKEADYLVNTTADLDLAKIEAAFNAKQTESR